MTRIIASVGATLLLVGGVALAQSRMFPEKEAVNKSRAQIPVAGAPADTLTISAASDKSTALSKNSVYMFTCGTDTHVRWSDTATCTAVATDFRINSGVIIYFATGPGTEATYVCGIRNSADGTCYINEVR